MRRVRQTEDELKRRRSTNHQSTGFPFSSKQPMDAWAGERDTASKAARTASTTETFILCAKGRYSKTGTTGTGGG